MKILVFGNDLIHKSSRLFWKDLACVNKNNVIDLLLPKKWRSDFIKYTKYRNDPLVDGVFNKTFVMKTVGNKNPDGYFYCGIKLWWILCKSKYDVIVIKQRGVALSVFQFMLVKMFTRNRKTKCYLITTNNIKEKLSFVQRFRERFSMKRVAVVLCPSKEVKSVLERKDISKECRYFPFSYDQDSLSDISEDLIRKKFLLALLVNYPRKRGSVF